jgi:hypothetical protein
MKPGDRVIWRHSPRHSILTGWRTAQIPAIVVHVYPRRIKIRIFLNAKEKTVTADPDTVISQQERK